MAPSKKIVMCCRANYIVNLGRGRGKGNGNGNGNGGGGYKVKKCVEKGKFRASFTVFVVVMIKEIQICIVIVLNLLPSFADSSFLQPNPCRHNTGADTGFG
ncbi:hypothetical protein H5410_059669 [Solanum commersonii]|uniref:Uncharacterized protein n=1 Tax=Solanum commersonii TaxID=4109 RepID=A0A9J5W3D7_SOLCO|nr:hypothetical protein H5410_059669 [Solanum commersonii]